MFLFWKDKCETLMRNKNCELVPKPHDKNVVGCKWVFKTTYDFVRDIEKYMAHIVVEGFS